MEPPLFFPVTREPLRMRAGLHAFGQRFAQHRAAVEVDPVDERVFIADDQRQRYLENARALATARYARLRGERRDALFDAAVSNLRERAEVDGAIRRATSQAGGEPEGEPGDALDALCRDIQEDVVLCRRDPSGRDEVFAHHVCTPSGWAPERITGASFSQIHHPVPEFADDARVADSMVRAMLERGPYVRFVWTCKRQPQLDLHPDPSRRRVERQLVGPGSGDPAPVLRVERQITWPVVRGECAAFVIRVFEYPFARLSGEQRDTLATALRRMPEPVARYKGLVGPRAALLAALERM